MRIAYILSPLLLLTGCATPGMGPHAHGAQAQPMQNCPMASSPASGDQQHGAMMGDHAGQMMDHSQMQGEMGPGMHPGEMTNCPMAQGAAPPAPPPADAHQH
jgi:hypothetical protein